MPSDLNHLPRLERDSAFHGMTATQFFGAFNDNLFKQLVLLVCVDYALTESRIAAASSAPVADYQPAAQAMFAIPFVLFSGFAGYLSDRMSKRTIVVAAKVAEIAIMLLGMAAFWIGGMHADWQLPALLAVLFLMGTQSAFFGPSKYGILPELFRARDLPRVNGMIQMTTFVAIIFGMALAGYAKEWFGSRLWIISGMCVGIAFIGTATSLFVRKTSPAHPGLAFRMSSLAINGETWRMLRGDKALMGVLLIASLFWFVGGVVPQAVNAFGKLQLGIGDARSSTLAACMGVGIAIGCVVAGKASHERIRFGLVSIGAWGLVFSLAAVAGLGLLPFPEGSLDSRTGERILPAVGWLEWLMRLDMACAGFFAGLFVVPLQVFMQARPPEAQKGRMIGAMNLVNWIGILGSAAFFLLCSALFGENAMLDGFGIEAPIGWTFALLALVLLPVAIFYRPKEETLS